MFSQFFLINFHLSWEILGIVANKVIILIKPKSLKKNGLSRKKIKNTNYSYRVNQPTGYCDIWLCQKPMSWSIRMNVLCICVLCVKERKREKRSGEID